MDSKQIISGNAEPSNDLTAEQADTAVASEEKVRTALEFEIETAPNLTEQTTSPAEEQIAEEQVVEDVAEEHSELQVQGEPVGEPDIPDIFADEQAQTSVSTSFITDPLGIKHTYVPRFTEVSDTYRMKNDPRPDTEVSSVVTARSSAKDSDASEKDIDPTAEYDDNVKVEKVIVTSTPTRLNEPVDENITVYKFATENSSDEARQSVPVADREIPKVEEDIIEELQGEPVRELPREEERRGEYSMPDPVSGIHTMQPDDCEDESEEPRGARDLTEVKGEFNSPKERDKIKDRFLDVLMATKIRLIAALLLLVGVVLFEIFSADTLSFLGLSGVSFASAVLDLQFVVCLFLLALPELIRGFRGLAQGALCSELLIPVSLILLIIYTVVIGAVGAVEYMLFGALFALQVLSAVIATHLRIKSEFEAFKLIAVSSPKNAVDTRLTRELPRENMALDGAVDEYYSVTARMFSASFISGFVKNSSRIAERSLNTLIVLAISLGAALISALVAFLSGGYDGVYATQTLTAVFLLACPALTLLRGKLPCRYALREAQSEENIFIGERALYDAANINVLTYEDTEVFGIEDVTIRKVHLYGKAYNTAKAMKQMYSLFSVVGGPLDYVFSSSLDRKCDSADGVVIEPDGISGVFDGHRVCAGTEDYMRRHGVTIPADDHRTKISSTDSTKVMYGAEDGAVYVKFFIRYSFSEEFTMILPYIKESGIVPLIYTKDPNISVELLRVLTYGEDIIRVMKKNTPQSYENRIYRRVDSDMVTMGDKSNVFNMLLLANRYKRLQASLDLGSMIFSAIGAVIAAIFALSGVLRAPAMVLAAWQLLGLALLYVRTRLEFGPQKQEKGNE